MHGWVHIHTRTRRSPPPEQMYPPHTHTHASPTACPWSCLWRRACPCSRSTTPSSSAPTRRGCGPSWASWARRRRGTQRSSRCVIRTGVLFVRPSRQSRYGSPPRTCRNSFDQTPTPFARQTQELFAAMEATGADFTMTFVGLMALNPEKGEGGNVEEVGGWIVLIVWMCTTRRCSPPSIINSPAPHQPTLTRP